MKINGNITTPQEHFYGELETDGARIGAIRRLGMPRAGADWVFPGFIDMHVHGLGGFDSTKPREMAAFAARTGITGICPTLAPDHHEKLCQQLKECRDASGEPPHGSATIIGSHLEGPFIALSHKGGMEAHLVRNNADLEELEQLLEAAGGTMRLMTISPEVPNAVAAVRRLTAAGVTVSAGHTGCTKEQLTAAVDAGLSQACHLFDTFDGRKMENGVSIPCLADQVLIEQRIRPEIICDGIHVPEDLVHLARLAATAERLIAITDALPGAGMPDGIYYMTDGRPFIVKAGDVGRTLDGAIVGSCLTLNYAVKNMLERFGFTPVEVAKITARNPARACGVAERTGELVTGKDADIAVLGNDFAVRKTIVKGETAYEC